MDAIYLIYHAYILITPFEIGYWQFSFSLFIGVQNVEFILTGTIRQELDFESFAYH